jgi:hypothetical protein
VSVGVGNCLVGSTGVARLTLTGMLLCGALFAGCGDAGGGEGSTERFIDAGDRLCVRLGERLKGSSTLANSPAALVRSASGYRDFTRDLSAGLTKSAPDADAAAKRIVDDSAKLATIARRQKLRAKEILARQRRHNLASAQRLGRAYNRTARGSQLRLANRLDAPDGASPARLRLSAPARAIGRRPPTAPVEVSGCVWHRALRLRLFAGSSRQRFPLRDLSCVQRASNSGDGRPSADPRRVSHPATAARRPSRRQLVKRRRRQAVRWASSRRPR